MQLVITPAKNPDYKT